jgi:hypothetical protein
MRTEFSLKKAALRSGQILGLVAICLMLPGVCAAQPPVLVDCSGGPLPPGVYSSINGALVSPALMASGGNGTILVTGTCNEALQIFASNLTIAAPPGQTATIVTPDTSINSGTVVWVFLSRNITLRRLIIRGGATGVRVDGTPSVRLSGCTIENNSGVGLNIESGSSVFLANFIDEAEPVVIRNNGLQGIRSIGSLLQMKNTTVANNGNGFTGVEVDGGHAVFLENTTVENSNGSGIQVSGGRITVPGNSSLMVRGNTGLGMLLISGASASFGGTLTVQNNAGTGIALDAGASANFTGMVTVQNNGNVGIGVGGASSATFTGTFLPDGTPRATLIEGHQIVGLGVFRSSSASLSGPHRIRNNGLPGPPPPFEQSGIRVINGGSLQLSNGVAITNNTGPGILADLHASILLITPAAPSVMITGNTAEGIRLTLQSAARFVVPPTITGNGSAAVGCDSSSLVGGDLTGVHPVDCKVEKGKK